MKKTSAAILFLILVSAPIIYIALLPNTINAAAYIPVGSSALEEAWQPNTLLQEASLLGQGMVTGPEDVDVDKNGNVYAGLADGRIVRIDKKGLVTDFAHTGGRPLGLHFDEQGRLIVADANKGLLSIDPNGIISVLVSKVNGNALKFTDDLDIASDGIIYFSDASSRFGIEQFKLDILEAKPWGRLLSYNPETKLTTILLDDLYFANGVALSKDEDFVLVNETARYRITRYWLKGPKKGTSDIFIDNLPGFPDGISANREGLFWLALATPRNLSLDSIHPYPSVKNFSAKLPDALQPQPVAYGFVAVLDEDANVIKSFHDASGDHLKEITSAQQVDNKLYLGTLHGDRIGVLSIDSLGLPKPPPHH